jgi:surfeit locus 1 family protein
MTGRTRTAAAMDRVLTWRSARLAGVALVLVAAMVVLGLWQLGVYDDHQQDDAQAKLQRPAEPLTQVLGPDDAFPGDAVSQPVRVTGRYLPGQQFEVHNGSTLEVRRAVVTPLQVSGAPGGSAVLVVRGEGGYDEKPPAGEVSLTGVLEPSDSTGSGLDERRVTDNIRIAALVQRVEPDLYSGYVILTSSDPADSLEPIRAPSPAASRWAGIRNLLYAIQWWAFAAFVGFMWWRMVTDPPPGSADDSGAGDGGDADDAAAEARRSVV